RSPFASASSTAWRTSLVRNPFVSPEIIPSMLLHPHTRFMQQRLRVESGRATWPERHRQPHSDFSLARHTLDPYLR
ncbi:MAG: hypothetical protein VB140_06255, partial [Burkholderia sp.]